MNTRWHTVATAAGLTAPDGTTRPTIFAEMSALAQQHSAANLGQGFPDVDGPAWVRDLAASAITDGANQYPPGRGTTELRRAIADHQARHYDITVNPDTEVLVTVGATEAIAATLLALTGPGDEVVTLEPFYDAHTAAIALAGATHVTVPLTPDASGFRLDVAALDTAVTERTRLILVNTPHNPTGTVLTREELTAIAAAATRVGAIVVTDEVYEHLTYGDAIHVPFATLPGMAERTLTISSAGKTFSLTGWKIGWISGPATLIEAITAVKQFLTYAGGTPFQGAIAAALSDGDPDIAELRDSLAARKDLLIAGLREVGFTVTDPGGSYFVCADANPFFTDTIRTGAEFARTLPERAGVACIPVTAFCHSGSATASALNNWVRFTFVKDEATIRTAIERLASLRNN